jgi:ribosomal protein L6P/L9E
MKTYKIILDKNYKKGKLVKWSGGFSQLTLFISKTQKTIFIPTHNVNLKNNSELILGIQNQIVSHQDLKWWGTLKQQIDSWKKEQIGYYEQDIEIRGTGYKFEIESSFLTDNDNNLSLSAFSGFAENRLKIDLGKSHEYVLDIPAHIVFTRDKNMTKSIKGQSTNKQDLTQYLANIRKFFPLNAKQHGIVIGPLKFITY